MTIQQDLQRASIGAKVELYILDLTALGGGLVRFTPNTDHGVEVSFDGHVYQVLPVTSQGWDTSLDGAPPQPTITLSNVTKQLQGALTQYDNLIGGKLTRFCTLDKYLDSGATPDGSEVFDLSVHMIEQKTKHNERELTFKLSSVIDKPNMKLPRGQVLRSVFPGCGLYRR